MSDNRRIRVFVSSTFRDMIEERDELMSQVWPELRRFCRERQVDLVEVDLRWGISEEQSTRKETLKLCLGEIRACRPFFIGLLGERYGWIPGDDTFTSDLIGSKGIAGYVKERRSDHRTLSRSRFESSRSGRQPVRRSYRPAEA